MTTCNVLGRGTRKTYEAVLRRVPDVASEKRDELSNNRMQTKPGRRRRLRS
jgi:hypothetical protein